MLFCPQSLNLLIVSLSEGVVPTDFNTAVDIPLINNASLPLDNLKSYRLVSGLYFISKFVEQMVAKKFSYLCSCRKIFNHC